MMEEIKIWIQGIIFAVIISTVIEMIIPDNNSKKYIKTVIGVFIIYVIIGPIISKFTGKSLNININDYLKPNTEMTYSSINIDDTITTNYIENIKTDITQKLEMKGYNTENIEIIVSENEESYGEILKISLNIINKNVKNIEVEKIDISNTKEQAEFNSEIKEFLVQEYGTNNILINAE